VVVAYFTALSQTSHVDEMGKAPKMSVRIVGP